MYLENNLLNLFRVFQTVDYIYMYVDIILLISRTRELASWF